MFYIRVFGLIASFYDVPMLTFALTPRKAEGQTAHGLAPVCCFPQYTAATTIHKLTVFCDSGRFPALQTLTKHERSFPPWWFE